MARMTEVKRVQNAVLMTDGNNDYIRIDGVRLSFPKIGHPEPEEDDNGNPRLDGKGKQKMRYSGVFMAPKATHEAAKTLCVEIINKLQKANDVKIATDKKFIKDGDGETREEYAEHWIINAGESNRPAARNRRGELIQDPDEVDDMFFAGAIVNVLLRPWYFGGKAKGATKEFPKRISCGLVGVQFVKDDGVSFGSARVDESDAWDSVDVDDDLDGDDDL